MLSQLWLGLVGRALGRPLMVWELVEGGSGSLGKEGLAGCSTGSPCGGGGGIPVSDVSLSATGPGMVWQSVQE